MPRPRSRHPADGDMADDRTIDIFGYPFQNQRAAFAQRVDQIRFVRLAECSRNHRVNRPLVGSRNGTDA